jgi:hypothetical protein
MELPNSLLTGQCPSTENIKLLIVYSIEGDINEIKLLKRFNK